MKQRQPALDAVRAIAALAVFAHHADGLFPAGWMGVPIFYVLSGYFITKHLLEQQKETLGTFYQSRVIRIVPAYMVYVATIGAVLCTFGAAVEFMQMVPTLVTFTYNWGSMSPYMPRSFFTGHLWTLSVEIQFYAIWPLVLRRAGARFNLVCLMLIVVAPALRFACYQAGLSMFDSSETALTMVYLFSPGYIDAFAAGALVAAGFPIFNTHLKKTFRLIASIVAFGAVVGFEAAYNSGTSIPLLSFGYKKMGVAGWQFVWAGTVLSLFFASGIAMLIQRPPRVPKFLSSLGRMSYSFYLWHTLVLFMTFKVYIGENASPARIAIGVAMALALTTCAARISWGLFEQFKLQPKK